VRYAVEGDEMSILGEWEKLEGTIDDDMQLIYPDMYLEYEHLYDNIIAIGYIFKDLKDPKKGLDWAPQTKMNDILSKNPGIAVISKVLLVRLRLPWYEVNTEWLVNEHELKEHADEYEVLDVFIYAKHIDRGDPEWILGPRKTYFETHRDEFKVIEKRYSVRWKWSDEEKEKLLSEALIDGDNIHEYISQ